MKTFVEWLYGTSQERTEKEARDKFQIEEFNGYLYLTCDNTLVCPMDMFDQEPIDALIMIRDLYVKRNTKET